MDQLITLSKLASLVSESTGIGIAICEAFIRNMAQTTASGLIEGEHIRIKDFGLFEIRHADDGAVAIDFIPESAFAERVNAPLAHLRPSELPNRRTSAQPAPQQPSMPQTPSYTPQPEAPAFAPQQPAMPQAPAYTPQPEAPAFAPQQPAMPQAPAYTPQQDGAPDLPAYLNLPNPGITESEPKLEFSSETYHSPASRATVNNRQLPQLSTNKKYVLIGVLGLIVGFVLGYLTARYSSDSQKDTPEISQEAPEMANNEIIPPVEPEYDHNSSLNVADIDTLQEDNESVDTPEAQPAPEVITVKLQKGQRLSDIAQKHYGKKEYWVYIYLENRETISNPFTVREGAVLRIPPKDKYAPTTDEAANLAWAKSKAAEINSKYIN